MRKNRSVSLVEKTAELYSGDQKKLTAELKRLVKEGQRTGDLLKIGAAYCNLAEATLDLDDNYGAFSNSLKAIAFLKDTEAYELLARAYIVLGLVYTYQDNPQMALSIDETAYQLVRKHRIQGRTRITLLNSLSANYQMLGNGRKGIRLLQECLSLVEADPEEDLVGRAKYTLNLAYYYREDGDVERSWELLASMGEWIGRVEYQAVICDYYLRCAIVAYVMEDPQRGDGYADSALALLPKDVCPVPVYDDLQELSGYLCARRDRERAGKILEFMTAFSEKSKGTVQHLFIYRTMADYYRAFGEPERAVECYQKLEELHDAQKRETRDTQLRLMQRMRAADAEIRKLKKEMHKNDELASLEPLTRLLNRSALLEVSSEFFESAARRDQKVGAIFIDIDFFKECNDTYGHARGDEIIREVAYACRKEQTKNVRFARYGGDEFFGITRGLTDEQVCSVARRIAATIRDADLPHVNNPNGGRITLSVGVVNMWVTDRTNTILDIVNNADKAVYHAKSKGKNAIYQQVLSAQDVAGSGVSYVRIDF